MYEVKEQDWKRFRRKLPDWQESYMAKLNQEYIRLLSGEGSAADKFWALENRIRQDKKSIGVSAEMRRSQMLFNLTELARNGTITEEDLDGFSDELAEVVKYMIRR